MFGPSARLGFQEEELASNEIVLEVGRWVGGIVKSEERSFHECVGYTLLCMC
jgi:hypothetical protein